MLGLAFLSTAVAYLIYFRLIENVGPTSTLTVTLLVPVFGLLFGVLLLDEPFGLGTLAGLGIILTSVVLITGIANRKSKPEEDYSGQQKARDLIAGRGSSACIGRVLWACHPSSSETVASHTCVVRPPWTSFASHPIAPPRFVPTKLLFSSMVVKPSAPSGRFTNVP